MKAKITSSFREHFLLHIMVVAYIVILASFSLMRHYAFMSSAWDLGIFNQAFHTTTNEGRFFYYTVELYANPKGNLFGVHFSPILLFLLPFYAIFNGAETLLILQTIALAIGVYPLFFLARDTMRLKSMALIFSLLYLTFPHTLGVNLFDFHPDAFFVPLTLFSLYFFYKRSWIKYFVFMILAFLTKEFASLPFCFFGFAGLWFERGQLSGVIRRKAAVNKRVWALLATILIGVVWFFSANTLTYFLGKDASSGFVEGSPWAILGGYPLDPSILGSVASLNYVGALEYDFELKLLYFFTIIGPFAFLPMLKLSYFLPTIVWIFPSFLSNYAPYYALGYHYSAFFIPFVAVSAILGYGNFVSSMKVSGLKAYSILRKLLICSLLLSLSIGLTLQALTAGVSLSVISDHDRSVYKTLAFLPRNASVVTQFDIFPHLSDKMNAFVIPPRFEAFEEAAYYSYVEALFNGSSEYVLVDINPDFRVDSHREVSAVALAEIQRTGRYGRLVFLDGVVLYKLDYLGPVKLHSPLGLVQEFRPFRRIDYAENVLFEQALPIGVYKTTIAFELGEKTEGKLCTLRIEQGEDTLAMKEIVAETSDPTTWESASLSFTVTSQMKELRFIITESAKTVDLYIQSMEITQSN